MRPDLRELAQEQERLRAALVPDGFLPASPLLVAGCDVTFVPARGARALALAAIVVMDVNGDGPGETGGEAPRAVEGRGKAGGAVPLAVEVAEGSMEVTFPYVPGFLAYRELPALLAAYRLLRSRPDVYLLDAQGMAHPRGLGLASHFGVLTGERAVGCAKSWLYGAYAEPGPDPWSWSPLRGAGGEVVGAAVRPAHGRRLLFVSPGHRVGLEAALGLVRRTTHGHRLPEPLRLAHLHLQARRREALGGRICALGRRSVGGRT